MPRSRNAASKARLAESVSTVEPDLDDTTSTVWVRPPASASPSSAASTWPGEVESRITSGTPAVCAMTSGASDEPPMPASTTRVTPLATSSARSASISATSGRETLTASTQPRRLRSLGLGGGPPQRRVAGGDAGRDEVGDQPGERLVDDRLDVPAQVDLKAHRAISGALRSAVSTVSFSSCHEAMNFSTPSSSSTWVTSAKSTPTAASWSKTPCASA